MAEPYRVELAPAALRAYQALGQVERARVRTALLKAATAAAQPGDRAGKAIKSITGVRDHFARLRVGDHRVMLDLVHADRVVLVLGIIHRRELEAWLRRR